MGFFARFRFLLGILFVIALCAGLLLYLEHSMARVNSVNAQLDSDTYTVGLDYSGIIENQYIQDGAYIKAGDPLFEIRSTTLAESIRNNEVARSELLYTTTDNGQVKISAAADGRVRTIKFRKGAFVPANSELATIDVKDGIFISATYKLSSPDYARLSKDSLVKVRLPDNTTVDGRVYDVSLKTQDKEVYTTVKTRIDPSRVNQDAFSSGTPVETTLYLNNDTWLTSLKRTITKLFQPAES